MRIRGLIVVALVGLAIGLPATVAGACSSSRASQAGRPSDGRASGACESKNRHQENDDRDGDGIRNDKDPHPDEHPFYGPRYDQDEDGTPDDYDVDRDGDGIDDYEDPHPDDPSNGRDYRCDGAGDPKDPPQEEPKPDPGRNPGPRDPGWNPDWTDDGSDDDYSSQGIFIP